MSPLAVSGPTLCLYASGRCLMNSSFGAKRNDVSFRAQRLHGIEPRGEISGNQRGERADDERADANPGDVAGHDLRGNFGELIDARGKDFDAKGPREPAAELIPETHQPQSRAQSDHIAKKSHDHALRQEDPDNLRRP